LSAERAGGGGRRRACVRERECDWGWEEDGGEDTLRRTGVAGGYSCGRRPRAGRCGVRERWRPIAICW